jgi:hypothetical protein
MQPQIPFVIPRDLVPPAPKDMFAGMGKNDQRLYVVPSQRLVVVRMGDPADTIAAAISGFDDELWKRINALPCATSVSGGVNSSPNAWPNPASTSLSFDGDHADLYDVLGTLVARASTADAMFHICHGAPTILFSAAQRHHHAQRLSSTKQLALLPSYRIPQLDTVL